MPSGNIPVKITAFMFVGKLVKHDSISDLSYAELQCIHEWNERELMRKKLACAGGNHSKNQYRRVAAEQILRKQVIQQELASRGRRDKANGHVGPTKKAEFALRFLEVARSIVTESDLMKIEIQVLEIMRRTGGGELNLPTSDLEDMFGINLEKEE